MRLISMLMAAALAAACAATSVPLRWTVETSRASPASFEQYRGTSIALEATLNSYERPLAVEGEPRLYWQTNGMGSAWWSAPATASNNVLRATFGPENDIGATSYTCFIGIPGSVYSAAFRLRMLPSPGAKPNTLPIPVPRIDFSEVEVTNAPWASSEDLSAMSGDVAGLSSSVSAIWSYAFGKTAWIAVTNYSGVAAANGVAPSFQLLEVRDGRTNVVYSSGAEVASALSNEVAKLSAAFGDMLEEVRRSVPSPAWSRYQSASGAPNPASNDVTVLSTPSVMLTGGAEWEQYVDVASNSLWILTSKGMHVTSGDSNGWFRISGGDGKAAFEVVTENASIADALPAGNPAADQLLGTMTADFIAAAQPVLYTSPTLKPKDGFMPEGEDPNCDVAWTNLGGNRWRATVEFVNVLETYFAFAMYTRPGRTVVRNHAPMDVSGGIICPDGVTRICPKVSAGIVTWEVVP